MEQGKGLFARARHKEKNSLLLCHQTIATISKDGSPLYSIFQGKAITKPPQSPPTTTKHPSMIPLELRRESTLQILDLLGVHAPGFLHSCSTFYARLWLHSGAQCDFLPGRPSSIIPSCTHPHLQLLFESKLNPCLSLPGRSFQVPLAPMPFHLHSCWLCMCQASCVFLSHLYLLVAPRVRVSA